MGEWRVAFIMVTKMSRILKSKMNGEFIHLYLEVVLGIIDLSGVAHNKIGDSQEEREIR